MDTKYYLLPTKYDIFEIGSIFKHENDDIIDLDTNIEPKYDKDVANDWIILSAIETKWLLKKCLSERIECHKTFKDIENLKKGSECFYRTLTGDMASSVIEKAVNADQIVFTIKLEDGKFKDVPLDDIELCTNESKYSKDFEDIMKLLLDKKGDIQENDLQNRCVLSLVYNLPNKRFFKMLLDTNPFSLNLNQPNIQALLHVVVGHNKWNILDQVLKKCAIDECNNTFLIDLAIEALQKGNNELLSVILRFSKKINKLANGETFLTNLFKANIGPETITKVIEMKLFDVNAVNDANDTPLNLASDRMYIDVVTALLARGADADFDNSSALQKSFIAKTNNPNKAADANAIIALLRRFRQEDTAKNIIVDPSTLTVPADADAALDSVEQKLMEIMKLLVLRKGNIIEVKDNVSILTLAYELQSRRLFHIFVHKHNGTFDLLGNPVGQNLLTKIVNNKDMVALRNVLEKLDYKDEYEVFLLNSAFTTVKCGMKHHYKMIVDKCKDKNKVIQLGETFLTQCFKENVKENLILDIIKSDFFDINIPNNSQKTVLLLACEKMMTNCVNLLLEKGADKTYNNYCAFDIVVAQGSMTDDVIKRKAAKNNILDLLSGKNAKLKGKLEFTKAGFVDRNNISAVSKINLEFQIEDPVLVKWNDTNVPPKSLKGTVKWFGIVNDHNCVGIELNDGHPDANDGTISGNYRFECVAGRGILTTLEMVELDTDALRVHYLPNGLIDPEKYLKCQENTGQNILSPMGIKINDIVYAKVVENNADVNLRGKLRWLGTMNGAVAAVVELDNNHRTGSNGRFWKHQLITCNDNRAVALNIENIIKYIPFKKRNISLDERKFPEIDLDSRVLCYVLHNGYVENLIGTVRWSGLDTGSNYVYGIELDNEWFLGTDGEFEGQRLFQCKTKHGILSSLDNTAPEVVIPDPENNQTSNDSEVYRSSIPNLAYYGDNCGIQGHGGSSFIDSLIYALFSKSDIIDFIIQPRLNEIEKCEFTKKIRNIMLWKVVCPVREFTFVSSDKIQQLRMAIKEYNPNCDEILNPGNDLENFEPVLQKLARGDLLLNFVTPTNDESSSMFLKTIPKSAKLLTSQQLLNMSMIERNLFFDKIPTCLILKIPINQKQKLYPLDAIDISHLCADYYKQCSSEKCGFLALYRCQSCAEMSHTDKTGLLCQRHKCQHPDVIKNHKCKTGSKSHVPMFLISMVCFSEGHSVAYVKENKRNDEWVYFDNGANEKPIIPAVRIANDVTLFLKNDLQTVVNDLNPSEKTRQITEDAYILVYSNSTKSCY